MTNTEFQQKLQGMYDAHPFIGKSKRKTLNELVWILRQDNIDYNINIPPYHDDMGWVCIPSVKECFIPVRDLAMHVKEVVYEEFDFEDDFKYDGICLTVYLEE